MLWSGSCANIDASEQQNTQSKNWKQTSSTRRAMTEECNQELGQSVKFKSSNDSRMQPRTWSVGQVQIKQWFKNAPKNLVSLSISMTEECNQELGQFVKFKSSNDSRMQPRTWSVCQFQIKQWLKNATKNLVSLPISMISASGLVTVETTKSSVKGVPLLHVVDLRGHRHTAGVVCPVFVLLVSCPSLLQTDSPPPPPPHTHIYALVIKYTTPKHFVAIKT